MLWLTSNSRMIVDFFSFGVMSTITLVSLLILLSIFSSRTQIICPFTVWGPKPKLNWTILLFWVETSCTKIDRIYGIRPAFNYMTWHGGTREKEIVMYTIVHRFNNRWRWCRFTSSIFKTMRYDMHKLEFKQFYSFIRWKILFFILWVINFQYLW